MGQGNYHVPGTRCKYYNMHDIMIPGTQPPVGVSDLNRVNLVTTATNWKILYFASIMAVSQLTSQPAITKHLLYYQVDFLLNKSSWELKFFIIAIMIGTYNYDCILDIIRLQVTIL